MAKSPGRRDGKVQDAAENPMTPDDDILPRRVVGEEPIAREALQDAANPYQRGERMESYNASAEERDDLDEGTESMVPIEDAPSYSDIMPDQIQRMAGSADNEDEVTARPDREIRPITPDELPEG